MVIKFDIAHPSAFYNARLDTGNLIVEARRVILVDQLTDGSADQAATALGRATDAVGIHIGDAHPYQPAANAGCVCRDVRTVPVPGNDNAALVMADYWTVIATFNQGIGIISVERDSALVQTTDQLHPSDLSQMFVIPPTAVKGRPLVPVTFSYTQPCRKLVITANVALQNMTPVELAVNSVNSNTWFGLPKGFWRFERIRDQQQLGTANIAVVLEFITRNTRNWLQFEAAKSEMFGVPLKVDDTVITQARNISYFYGWQPLPGLTVAGLHPLADFGSIFGITKWPR